MCCCAPCLTGEVLDCERVGFCGPWRGKGRSAQPHNFVKYEEDRNGDYLWDKTEDLSYSFDGITT